MAVENLPRWSILPNWRSPVLERLESLTSILASPSGAEQRFAVRWSPRRYLEPMVTPIGPLRTLFDMAIGTVGVSPWYVPLWHDRQDLTETLGIGDTSLNAETLHREIKAGGFVMLWADEFTTEVLEVTSATGGVITFAAGPVAAWPAGTRLYPCVRARLVDMPEMSRLGPAVLENAVRFMVDTDNDYVDPDVPSLPYPTYLDFPVLTTRSDEGQDVTHGHARLFDEIDGESGRLLRYDTAGIDFTLQQHHWLNLGRQEHAELRSLFYYLDGRRNPLWLPTFAEDFVLVEDVLATDAALVVEKCGFTAYGGPRVGRDHLWIALRDGTNIFREITGSSLTGGGESIVLAEDVGVAFTTSDVSRICFIALSRLDTDTMEINHHSDTDGASRVSLIFRSAPNIRDASDWFPMGFPNPNETEEPCGAPCVPFIFADEAVSYTVSTSETGEGRSNVTLVIRYDSDYGGMPYTVFVTPEDNAVRFSANTSPGYIDSAEVDSPPAAILDDVYDGRIPGSSDDFPNDFYTENGAVFANGTSLRRFEDTPGYNGRGTLVDVFDASVHPIFGAKAGGSGYYLTTFDGTTVRFGAFSAGDAPLVGIDAISSATIDKVMFVSLNLFAAGAILTHDTATKRITLTTVSFYFSEVIGSGYISEGSAFDERPLTCQTAAAMTGSGWPLVVWREYSGAGPGGSVKARLVSADVGASEPVVTLYGLTALGVSGYTHLANREPVAAAVIANGNIAVIERRYETVGAQLRAYEVLVIHAPFEGTQSQPTRLTSPNTGPTGDVRRSADVRYVLGSSLYGIVAVAFENPIDNIGTTEVVYREFPIQTCTELTIPE